MTPTQISLIRDSFAHVAPVADDLAARFYAGLFARTPRFRLMFPADLAPQRAKLVAALALVVRSLDAPEALKADLRALGARHAGYGVRSADYALVGQALVDALAQVLGARFDSDTADAWAAAYDAVSAAMLDGAAGLGTAA